MGKLMSNLKKIVDKPGKRLGRGSGSGKGDKSGRGGKRHQSAKEAIPLHFEGGQAKITKKYPLLRGKGKNKSYKKTFSINLDLLNKFKAGEVVDREFLVKMGVLKKSKKNVNIKVLGTGKIDKKITLKLPASKKAKEKIEKAGGKIE